MRRALFRVRGITVWSYPAMLYVGTVCGILYGHEAARSAGLDAFEVWLATLLLLTIALLGARLLFVFTHWSLYRQDFGRIFDRQDGGAAQYGGLLAAVPLSWPLLRFLGIPFGDFWDIAVQTILVAMIFTRVGCLLNGCCAGRPARIFGIYLPNHLGVWQRRVPTQILEGVLAGILLILARVTWPVLPFSGAVFMLVSGSYASGRLPLESARERQPGEGRFTVQHGISVFVMAVSFGGLWALWPM
jgi:phosphatidylglycerol:prolipoprotein diacylglycerol transferase